MYTVTSVSESNDTNEPQPTLSFKTRYVGDGFVEVDITESQHQTTIISIDISYTFCTRDPAVASASQQDLSLTQHAYITEAKLRRFRTLYIRVPQRLYDYYMILRFGTITIHDTNVQFEMSKAQTVCVPHDFAQHPFAVGDTVKFQQTHSSFWGNGRIEQITEPGHGRQVAHVKSIWPWHNLSDKVFEIPVENMHVGFGERSRAKLIDIADWMQIYEFLFFAHHARRKAFHVFESVHDAILDNLRRCIFESDREQNEYSDEERWNFIALIHYTDLELDIMACAQFIAFSVTQFIACQPLHYEYNTKVSKYPYINDAMDVRIKCGLCQIDGCAQMPLKLRNVRRHELYTFGLDYIANLGASLPAAQKYDFTQLLQRTPDTECDVCAVSFHPMSYYYACDAKLETQHYVCLPCMKKRVARYQQFVNILNELYHVHELDAYCVSQIVHCVVGFVRLA